MSRIFTPESIESSPTSSQPLLEAVKKQLGSVPNLFRVLGNSPAALEGYLALNGALAKSRVDAKTRERIALLVAQVNGCEYCLAAHTYLGKNVAKLEPSELDANRRGESNDAKATAALRFVKEVVHERGHISSSAIEDVKNAGYIDEEIVEIIAIIALNTLTNYVNSVAGTIVDFPKVAPILDK